MVVNAWSRGTSESNTPSICFVTRITTEVPTMDPWLESVHSYFSLDKQLWKALKTVND